MKYKTREINTEESLHILAWLDQQGYEPQMITETEEQIQIIEDILKILKQRSIYENQKTAK